VSRAAGAARGLMFTPALQVRALMKPRRWVVWYFENETWRSCSVPMPEGAAASYADVEHRYASAIAMEAV
jgi:hypothetical protein